MSDERTPDEIEADLRARRDRHRSRIRAAAIPADLAALGWDDLDPTDRETVIAAARRWAAGELPGLLLAGAFGVGKTRLAAVAANALLERRSLRWTSAPMLFARLGTGRHDTQQRYATDLLTGRQALVLDDIDKARPTEYGAEVLFTAIDSRITEGAPLVVTTNLKSEQLAARYPQPYGEAITSRLVGYCEAHQLTGSDRRLTTTGETR